MPFSELVQLPTKKAQIVAQIEQEIRAGVLPPGGRILPRSKLCERFGASSAVVNAAYDELERKGLITRTARSGVTVSASVEPTESLLLGVVTIYRQGDIDGYFEALLEVARERRMTSMIVNLKRDDWRRPLSDLASRRPDVVAVDVEGKYFPWNEIEEMLSPAPVCYVNRWEWVPARPERAVLVDYDSAWGEGLQTLWRRGHDRILQVVYGRHPEPHMLRTLAAGRQMAGFRTKDDRLATVSIEDLRELPDKVRQQVAEFAPTAILGQSDYFVRLLEELCPQTAALDRIGFFDTWHSRRPGNEFSSYHIDFEDIWHRAADSFNGAPTVVKIPPKLVTRGPATK